MRQEQKLEPSPMADIHDAARTGTTDPLLPLPRPRRLAVKIR